MNEIWKAIVGHDGYFVSNLGRFRRDARTVATVYGATRVLPARSIAGFIAKKTGYRQIRLAGKKVSAHRLVAFAFCEKPDGCDVVNHLDGNPQNNSAKNLEWTTFSGNNLHAFRVLGRKGSSLGKFSSEHHTSKPVVARCLSTGREVFYAAGMDAVRAGFSSAGITHCCRGRQKSHKGFVWRYATEAFGAEHSFSFKAYGDQD